MEIRRSRRLAGLEPSLSLEKTEIEYGMEKKGSVDIDEELRGGNIWLPACTAMLGFLVYGCYVFSLTTAQFARLF